MKLITPDEFADRYFSVQARPDKRTVLAWIRDGYVPGREIGPRRVYVDEDAWLEQTTGHELADRILKKTG